MAKPWGMLALLHLSMVAADLQIFPRSEPFLLVADFLDEEANFGDDVPKRGLSTMVVMAEPENACSPIAPPPKVPNSTKYWAVLIRRYNCTFAEKVLNAQNAFYDVAIVHNVDSNKLEIMNASNPEELHIVSIFVSANAGKEIKTNFLYDKGFVVIIEPNSSTDILGKILIPFVVVISVCFTFTIGVMVFKCIKDHRRARRRRLPYASLNKIPTAKFRKNDPFETCAICLDDFIEGEKLRILPCSHAYHCKCIDPWLTKNRRVCPMCKRKVFANDERMEDDDSSSDDDYHTPLLRGATQQNSYGGTNVLRAVARAQILGSGNETAQRQVHLISHAVVRDIVAAGPSSPNEYETFMKLLETEIVSVKKQWDANSESSATLSDTDTEGCNTFQDSLVSLSDNASLRWNASEDGHDANSSSGPANC